MKALRSIAREVAGLFVDDLNLALLAAAWIGIVGAAGRWGDLPPAWRGPLLFAGSAFALLSSLLGTRRPPGSPRDLRKSVPWAMTARRSRTGR
jgi:hypothetical protein